VNDAAAVTAPAAGTIPVLTNDTDVDGDTLSVVAVTQGTQGRVVISGSNVVYTPSPSASGTDTFTYTVSDGTLTAVGTVTLTITAAPTTTTTTTTTTTAAPTTTTLPPPAALPATGGTNGRTVTIAFGTLAFGAAMTLTARRRRGTSHH
jgi:hypothetical protein